MVPLKSPVMRGASSRFQTSSAPSMSTSRPPVVPLASALSGWVSVEAVARVEEELGREGRVLIRYSGTEPKARVMVEGSDETRVADHARELERQHFKLRPKLGGGCRRRDHDSIPT